MAAETYGEGYAELFDFVYGAEAPESMVAALADLAEDGPVLELGVGTGRVAIPLAARGLTVTGVDSSTSMLSALAGKPGGDTVQTAVSELPQIAVDGRYRLVACLDNTFLLLTTQDAQTECVMNAAQLLTDDGVLVVETFARAPGDFGVMPAHIGENATVLWAYQVDPLSQQFHIREIIYGKDLTHVVPFDGRGVSPAELDLMARLAGLRLRERWCDWERTPVESDSPLVISVFERSDG
ncbi:class I SAM-dependent DNA methyltransferase [Micromonospora craniellae]|uniref:Methyltransferase domain-containing protein n=1 Tax=Micromonospora craniellae TaxID=2294034 RepID=A0A372FTC3_9ACTN|nr:methyltransferase domain-containing protein [Micromonospora craniellae]QOC91739.1 methyltransferase domain-containing protein [Micromonospora craniellae]RFS43759.1 methyltransferase domain-containing protein [Micromonospora craniellae]